MNWSLLKMHAGPLLYPHGESHQNELYEGEINNIPFVFLPRHGRGHSITAILY